MRAHLLAGALAAGLAAALAAAGCSQILGIDHFTSGDGGAGSADAATIDASAIDASTIDASTTDGGIPDASPIDASLIDAGPCDLLTQSGCPVGDKCTWIVDSASPPAGHSGCAPVGTIAPGGACTLSGGTTGYDDCTKGNLCNQGVCKGLCDTNGGMPGCDMQHVCGGYSYPGGTIIGVCDARCDPLNDNDFGKGTKPGTICGATKGCYGAPTQSGNPTAFTCANAVTTLGNRAVCDAASGCAGSAGNPYLNGCGQGFEPLIYDTDVGSSSVVCISMCAPLDCYSPANSNCGGGANRAGALPHRCDLTDSTGTFNTGTDGDHCMYSWWFEQDGSTGKVLKSPTSDTVGFCMDHSKYHLADASGTPDPLAPWPACANLPLSTPGTTCTSADMSGCNAVTFGCVSTTTGMVPTMRTLPPVIDRPRVPYHPALRAY